jgi:hypothetical protein
LHHHEAYPVQAEADPQLSYLITNKRERKKESAEFHLWIRVCVFLGVYDVKEIRVSLCASFSAGSVLAAEVIALRSGRRLES